MQPVINPVQVQKVEFCLRESLQIPSWTWYNSNNDTGMPPELCHSSARHPIQECPLAQGHLRCPAGG